MNTMAPRASNKKQTPTTPSKADIQTTRNSPFVRDLKELPRTTRSAHTYEWLANAGKGDIFSAKTLAQAGVYKTPAAAASTLMRMNRAGLIKRVQRDGKDVKGAYVKA